jgi:hypothetical protein
VRSRTDASRCLISLRYLWPDNPSADRFPQPPYPLDGSGLLFDMIEIVSYENEEGVVAVVGQK